MIKKLNDNLLENVSGGDIYKVKTLNVHLYMDNAGDLACTLRNIYLITTNESRKNRSKTIVNICLDESEAFLHNFTANPRGGEYFKVDNGFLIDNIASTQDFFI